LGPEEGIIRFTFEMNEDWGANYASDFMEARVGMNRNAAREVLKDCGKKNRLPIESWDNDEADVDDDKNDDENDVDEGEEDEGGEGEDGGDESEEEHGAKERAGNENYDTK
jgi:hypothetical protein